MRSCRFPWSRARTVAAELNVSFVGFRDGACRRVLSLGTHIFCLLAPMAIRDPIMDRIVCLPLLFCVSGSPSKCNHSSSKIVSQRISSSCAFCFTLQRIFWTRERATKQVQICPASSWFLVASLSSTFYILSVSSSVSSVSCRFHAVFTRNRAIPSSWRTMFRNTLRILNLIVNPHPVSADATLFCHSCCSRCSRCLGSPSISRHRFQSLFITSISTAPVSRVTNILSDFTTNIRAPANRQREHVVFALTRVPCRVVIYLAAVRGLDCCYTVGGPADRAAAHAQQIALNRIGALNSRV